MPLLIYKTKSGLSTQFPTLTSDVLGNLTEHATAPYSVTVENGEDFYPRMPHVPSTWIASTVCALMSLPLPRTSFGRLIPQAMHLLRPQLQVLAYQDMRMQKSRLLDAWLQRFRGMRAQDLPPDDEVRVMVEVLRAQAESRMATVNVSDSMEDVSLLFKDEHLSTSHVGWNISDVVRRRMADIERTGKSISVPGGGSGNVYAYGYDDPMSIEWDQLIELIWRQAYVKRYWINGTITAVVFVGGWFALSALFFFHMTLLSFPGLLRRPAVSPEPSRSGTPTQIKRQMGAASGSSGNSKDDLRAKHKSKLDQELTLAPDAKPPLVKKVSYSDSTSPVVRPQSGLPLRQYPHLVRQMEGASRETLSPRIKGQAPSQSMFNSVMSFMPSAADTAPQQDLTALLAALLLVLTYFALTLSEFYLYWYVYGFRYYTWESTILHHPIILLQGLMSTVGFGAVNAYFVTRIANWICLSIPGPPVPAAPMQPGSAKTRGLRMETGIRESDETVATATSTAPRRGCMYYFRECILQNRPSTQHGNLELTAKTQFYALLLVVLAWAVLILASSPFGGTLPRFLRQVPDMRPASWVFRFRVITMYWMAVPLTVWLHFCCVGWLRRLSFSIILRKPT